MKSILSLPFNTHYYDLKNGLKMFKMIFEKSNCTYKKKKKKKKESTYKSLQPCRPVSVPVSLIAFRRTVNGTAFFSPDACANKVETINRTAMQMYAVSRS